MWNKRLRSDSKLSSVLSSEQWRVISLYTSSLVLFVTPRVGKFQLHFKTDRWHCMSHWAYNLRVSAERQKTYNEWRKAIGNKPFMMNNIIWKRERKKTEIAIFVCNITLLYLVTANYNIIIITKQRTTAGQPVTKQSGRNVGRKKNNCWKTRKKDRKSGWQPGTSSFRPFYEAIY